MGKVLRPFRRGREAETPGREMCKLREGGSTTLALVDSRLGCSG
jgi:hypothetical protein